MMTTLFIAVALLAAETGGRAEYIGGTLEAFTGHEAGRIQSTQQERLIFHTKKMNVEIPFRSVNLLEYGQKADRRYVAAILVSPLLLMSKKRDHFLTLGFSDDKGQQQAMVFRLEKGDVRTVLASLEARTGIKVQYQDNEARKAAWGSK